MIGGSESADCSGYTMVAAEIIMELLYEFDDLAADGG
jgi:hypothetical protein